MSSRREHHELVQRIFLHARRLPAEQRGAYLAEACAAEPELLREVEHLLELGLDSQDPVTLSTGVAAGSGERSIREHLERVAMRGPAHSRYRIEGELAQGGMGVVLKVWDEDLRRHMVMKQALGKSARSASGAWPSRLESQLVRFLEEAQVTAQLDHPGIVPVHELGLDAEGRVYFTMKLVKGQTLREVLADLGRGTGAWSPTRVLGLLLKICEAMSYAHSKGVIHRDLKPANIMVGRFGEVYVMDWGLARVLAESSPASQRMPTRGELEAAVLRTTMVDTERSRARLSEDASDSELVTMDGAIVGTPCYMPPEQALGDSSALGPRSDVYALGAILYQVLCGTPPYVPKGKTLSPHTVLAALVQGPPPPVRTLVPDAPEALAAICEKAMARESKDRYASAVELAADIQAYLEHRPVAARRYSLREVASLAYARNRPIVLISMVAVAVVLSALLLFVWRLQGEVSATQAAYQLLSKATAERERASALLAVRALVAEAEDLTITPADSGRLGTWIARVRELLEREAALRAENASAPQGSERSNELRSALAQFEDLRVLLPRVEEWSRTADKLSERIAGEDAEAWARASEAIERSPHYAGLRLSPQVGLVPLRENPLTGLWEFWHVASGVRPEVDSFMDDRYALTPKTGIVLVLLPPGEFVYGDDQHRTDYQGTSRERVAATFVGKYEVTQGQWQRAFGRNDAQYAAGVVLPRELRVSSSPEAFTELHPVEHVDWFAADRFCRRMGLRLPTEVEWEYGARASTATAWCWGDSFSDLEGQENVRDLEAQKQFPGQIGSASWNDGYPIHAPVGSFNGNDFGLFDVHGNVSEWCSDPQLDHWLSTAHARCFCRGGSWESPQWDSPGGWFSCAAFRYDRDARDALAFVGLRAARSVTP